MKEFYEKHHVDRDIHGREIMKAYILAGCAAVLVFAGFVDDIFYIFFGLLMGGFAFFTYRKASKAMKRIQKAENLYWDDQMNPSVYHSPNDTQMQEVQESQNTPQEAQESQEMGEINLDMLQDKKDKS
ncbi:MAG: hypothetical protein COV36_02890 [Alphaproteobacteria bacterium CG11_big_fil_rev_8_21_14_0_20_44_7]|nr:MAG: hypothetical protein COV36_02890 [Alphaproteobacteria bacterium CG11_big_fil_rev_8_21_14_0_20_44_7]